MWNDDKRTVLRQNKIHSYQKCKMLGINRNNWCVKYWNFAWELNQRVLTRDWRRWTVPPPICEYFVRFDEFSIGTLVLSVPYGYFIHRVCLFLCYVFTICDNRKSYNKTFSSISWINFYRRTKNMKEEKLEISGSNFMFVHRFERGTFFGWESASLFFLFLLSNAQCPLSSHALEICIMCMCSIDSILCIRMEMHTYFKLFNQTLFKFGFLLFPFIFVASLHQPIFMVCVCGCSPLLFISFNHPPLPYMFSINIRFIYFGLFLNVFFHHEAIKWIVEKHHRFRNG